MVVALLLYAYARGIRSSRAIERVCEEDVAFRVVAAHQVPDHTTIARFRQRHQDALAGLFGEVLALCADAGLVDAKVVAVDGTKVHANASKRATCDYEQLAREVSRSPTRLRPTSNSRSKRCSPRPVLVRIGG
jgi:transposase